MTEILNFLLILVGVITGLTGAFLSSPALMATAVILITTPSIVRTVDSMLVEMWSQVSIIFLLITGYISASIWALDSFLSAQSFLDRFTLNFAVTGAGFVQLAWICLFSMQSDESD